MTDTKKPRRGAKDGKKRRRKGKQREPLRFRPAARLQYLLSEQLVSDPNVAILEFIKNAYDADATEVSIEFDLADELSESSLVITDNGSGMDRDGFERNWMHPGFSEKVDAPPTSLHRIPVGEKGLGRLAAGRLGETLDVYSRTKASSPWFHAFFRWEDFNDKDKLLDEIPVSWDEVDAPPVDAPKTGTVIQIKELSLEWDTRPPGRRPKGRAVTRIGRLRQDLEVLLLPLTAGGQDFTIRLLHNSPLPEDAQGLVIGEEPAPEEEDDATPEKAREAETPSAKRAASAKGATSEEAPAPEKANGMVQPPKLELLDYEYEFQVKRRGKGWRLIRTVRRSPEVAEQTGEKAKTVTEVKSSELPKNLDLAACGPFSGSFYYAPKSKQSFKALRAPTGVRIYRDGVRVDPYGEPGDDWLGARERKAVRQGKAAIQPNALYGAVSVSRRNNPKLKPLANREGFIGNGALDAFFALSRLEFQEFGNVIERELLIPRWEANEAKKASEKAISSRQWAVVMTRATAHAVRQPVTSAGADLRSLRKVIDEGKGIPKPLRKRLRDLEENTKRHLERIDGAVGKMLGFLDVDPDPKEVELSTLVEEVIARAKPDAQSCGVALRHEKPDADPIRLRTPVGLVEHALEELLENAIQAPRPNGRKPWVEVRVHGEDKIRVDVADNGGGIDEGLRKKLFKQNVSRTGRIGVGLLINRQLMQIAQGDIELSSSSPEGSVFTLVFPS
ncbi:MAG TPA: sensor histidine kinase [Solirubrobacterales bacterium]